MHLNAAKPSTRPDPVARRRSLRVSVQASSSTGHPLLVVSNGPACRQWYCQPCKGIRTGAGGVARRCVGTVPSLIFRRGQAQCLFSSGPLRGQQSYGARHSQRPVATAQ